MTTPPPATPAVTVVAQQLLTCLDATTALLPDPPGIIALRPGVQAELLISQYDDECCQGMAWVRLVNLFPSSVAFPTQDVTYTRCGPVQWAAVFELGVARCAPTPDGSTLTSAQQWIAATEAVLADADAMRCAIECFVETNPMMMTQAGMWQPLPTDGGCMGGVQLVSVGVPDCDCPPAF